MEFRPFGNTDLKVSAIGFGCWEIGGTYGRIDESQFGRAVQQAIDNGITCFDTAEAYGMGVSEEALARALGGRRHDVSIVTKFGVGYEEMPNRRDSSRGRVLASIEKSLRRLRTDHVDAYLVHWPDPDTALDETMRALDDIVRQGKARYVGVSNFRLAQIEDCMRLRRIDVVQYGWNMFDRRMQAEIFPYCRAQEVGVMAYGSLAYGMLSGSFHAGMQFEESDWRSRGGMLGNLNLFRTLFGPEHFPRNLAAVASQQTDNLHPLRPRLSGGSDDVGRLAGRGNHQADVAARAQRLDLPGKHIFKCSVVGDASQHAAVRGQRDRRKPTPVCVKKSVNQFARDVLRVSR